MYFGVCDFSFDISESESKAELNHNLTQSNNPQGVGEILVLASWWCIFPFFFHPAMAVVLIIAQQHSQTLASFTHQKGTSAWFRPQWDRLVLPNRRNVCCNSNSAEHARNDKFRKLAFALPWDYAWTLNLKTNSSGNYFDNYFLLLPEFPRVFLKQLNVLGQGLA